MGDMANVRDFDLTKKEKTGYGEFIESYEFGGKLAAQLGADLSDARDKKRKDPQLLEAETRMAQAARVQDWKENLSSMSREDRIQATLDCLARKNNQKEILYDLLVYCEKERTEREAESFLENHKQFSDGHHTASKYLLFMQRTGALDECEYDSDGALITESMRDELLNLGGSVEEIDELAVEWRYIITDAGAEAIRRFNPAIRTKDLFKSQKESRIALFRKLLEFCSVPKSLDEIIAYTDGDPGLEVDSRTGVMHMQPSAYIGLLDQAGALTWENGWLATKGGMEALDSITSSTNE